MKLKEWIALSLSGTEFTVEKMLNLDVDHSYEENERVRVRLTMLVQENEQLRHTRGLLDRDNNELRGKIAAYAASNRQLVEDNNKIRETIDLVTTASARAARLLSEAQAALR